MSVQYRTQENKTIDMHLQHKYYENALPSTLLLSQTLNLQKHHMREQKPRKFNTHRVPQPPVILDKTHNVSLRRWRCWEVRSVEKTWYKCLFWLKNSNWLSDAPQTMFPRQRITGVIAWWQSNSTEFSTADLKRTTMFASVQRFIRFLFFFVTSGKSNTADKYDS